MRKATHLPVKSVLPVVLPLLWCLLLYACASSTQMTGSWTNPDTHGKAYHNIVIAGLSENILARQVVEQDMQNQLLQHGIKSTRSLDFFHPTTGESGKKPDVDQLLEKMRENDYDAVLTVALVDERTETRYVPGNYDYYPMSGPYWYGNFRGYYNYWYPILYQPGYYTEDKIYYLETNLYGVGNDELLWSAQSRSYSPSSLHKASEKLAEITINKLAQDKLIQARTMGQ